MESISLTQVQIIGIVSDLDYLHSMDIVHGDLKSVRAIPWNSELIYVLSAFPPVQHPGFAYGNTSFT